MVLHFIEVECDVRWAYPRKGRRPSLGLLIAAIVGFLVMLPLGALVVARS